MDLFTARWKRLERVHVDFIYDSVQTGRRETARIWIIYSKSAHYASFTFSFSLTDISPSCYLFFSIDPYTNSCLSTTNTHIPAQKAHTLVAREGAALEGALRENSMLGFKIAERNEREGPETDQRKGTSNRVLAKPTSPACLSLLMKLRCALGWN